jgi:hypothetical protein
MPKRAKTKPSKLSAKAIAKARRDAAPQPSVPGFERVLEFSAWARSKSISMSTAKRLRAAGKIKVVRLSTTRVGVSESADREFMKSCETT